jgi:hypothetical protein
MKRICMLCCLLLEELAETVHECLTYYKMP